MGHESTSARGWGLRSGSLTRTRTSLRARDLHYAVVDIETTGLDPAAGARVCEIAVVRMDGEGTVLAELSTLVDPRAPLAGHEFHGIGASDVIGAPRSDQLAGYLSRLCSGAVVVGHNLDFDERFLGAEFAAAGLPSGLPGLCTLRALRSQLDLERYSLPHASHALSGQWPTGQHTALGDARACAQLLAEMLACAPGELYFDGPMPALAPPRSETGADRVRLKPRTERGVAGLGEPDGPGVRTAPLRPRASWPARWRPLELDPAMCAGRFTPDDRAAAVADARRGRVRADVLSGAAALAGVLAVSGAVGVLGRRLRLR